MLSQITSTEWVGKIMSFKKFSLFRFNWLLRVFVIVCFVTALAPIRIAHADTDAGWSLAFDGEDDYVNLGITDSVIGVNWKDSKSFSLWVKPAGSASVCYMQDVAECEQILVNQPHFFGIARGIIGGLDRIWIWNYDGGYERIGIQYQADQWVNIAFVHANNTLSAYRNGNLVGQLPSNATSPESGVVNTNLLLGAFIRSDRTAAFEGQIDEVRIYNNELMQPSIINDLRTPLIGNEEGLRAYYQMSNGSGIVLTDDSIFSNDGTLRNGFPGNPSIGDGPQWVVSTAWDYPVANDQSVTVLEDSSIAIMLTGSPAQGGTLAFHLVDSPAYGALSGTIPSFTYTPTGNFNGSDSFTFYVTEGDLQSSLATVSIAVSAVNDPPVPQADEYSTNMNTPLVVTAPGVLSNDNDIDGDVLTVGPVEYDGSGILIVHSDGSFSYTPAIGFHGVDQFRYKVGDGTVFSNFIAVDITVNQLMYFVYIPLLLK